MIAPVALHAELTDALAGRDAVSGSVDAIDAAIAVLTPLDTKGLEFDHVVVVEPGALVDADRAGLRLLYVVLTRATRSLSLVHAAPLPEALVHLEEGVPVMTTIEADGTEADRYRRRRRLGPPSPSSTATAPTARSDSSTRPSAVPATSRSTAAGSRASTPRGSPSSCTRSRR